MLKKLAQAFTLAEVSVTIVIIGVVCLLVIPPCLTHNKYAEIQALLKKNYNITQQALMLMGISEGCTIPAEFENSDLHQYLREYYALSEICPDSMSTKEKTFCRNISYKTFNGANDADTEFFDDGSFATIDGALYMFKNKAAYITIDVNTVKKSPNKWGHDLFTFELTNDGRLLPMGYAGTQYTDMSQYCSDTSSSNLNGIACTYRALTEADYFKKLY